MEFSTLTVCGSESEAESDFAKFLGFVIKIASECEFHNKLNLRMLVDRALTAYNLNKYRLYFNNYGQCVGYVIWAALSPDVEKRLLSTSDNGLHVSEWSEGRSLWILDLAVPYGSLHYVLEDFRDNLFKDFDQVTYFKYKNGKRLAKRITRDSYSHYFGKRKMTY